MNDDMKTWLDDNYQRLYEALVLRDIVQEQADNWEKLKSEFSQKFGQELTLKILKEYGE